MVIKFVSCLHSFSQIRRASETTRKYQVGLLIRELISQYPRQIVNDTYYDFVWKVLANMVDPGINKLQYFVDLLVKHLLQLCPEQHPISLDVQSDMAMMSMYHLVILILESSTCA